MIGKMQSGLARLSGKQVVCRSQSDYHEFFIDIDQAKLAVFCLNGYQKDDSNKIMGLLDLCKGEDSNEPMGIIRL